MSEDFVDNSGNRRNFFPAGPILGWKHVHQMCCVLTLFGLLDNPGVLVVRCLGTTITCDASKPLSFMHRVYGFVLLAGGDTGLHIGGSLTSLSVLPGF